MVDRYDATHSFAFEQGPDGGVVMRAPDRRRIGARDGAIASVLITALLVTIATRQWLGVAFMLLAAVVAVSSVVRKARARVVLYYDRLVSVGVMSRTVPAEIVTGMVRQRVSYAGRTLYLVGLRLTAPRGPLRTRQLALPGLEVSDAWSEARGESLLAWQDAAVAEIARRWALPLPEKGGQGWP